MTGASDHSRASLGKGLNSHEYVSSGFVEAPEVGNDILSLARVAVCLLLLTLPAAAQAQAFEKITIKPARSADTRSMRIQVLPNGDLIAHAVSVIDLLSYAYGVPSNPSPRLNALPGWTVGDRYDIEAKAPANAIAANFNDSDAQARLQQIIRRLLADRLSLVMRVEHERMSTYDLTVSSGGPKASEDGALHERLHLRYSAGRLP